MTRTTIERALDVYKMDNQEFAAIQAFLPPQIGKVKINWRHVLDCLLIRFNFGVRGVAWHRIPHASTIRMSFVKAIEEGAFVRIAKALPILAVRQAMWQKVCEGAQIASTKRRSRQ